MSPIYKTICIQASYVDAGVEADLELAIHVSVANSVKDLEWRGDGQWRKVGVGVGWASSRVGLASVGRAQAEVRCEMSPHIYILCSVARPRRLSGFHSFALPEVDARVRIRLESG